MIKVAVSACIQHENRFLLVLRRNAPARDLWAFPGGSMDVGETVAQAVIREVAEETGLTACDVMPWQVHDLMPERAGMAQFVLVVCKARIEGRTQPVAGDDAAVARWFTLDEARALAMPASMHDAFAALAE